MSAVLQRVETLRVPPHNTDAEAGVLGAILQRAESLSLVADWLQPEDFYRRDHRLIYTAMLRQAEQGKPLDPVSLSEWLECQCLAEDVGGLEYLIELHGSTAGAALVVAHAEIVREKSQLRRGIDVGTRLVEASYAARQDARTLLASASHELATLQADTSATGLLPTKPLLQRWFEQLQRRHESGNRMTGLPTPWKDLNDITLGLQPTDCVVIGGRPGMGKSVMGFQLAGFTALREAEKPVDERKRAALFSLEMSGEQVVQRMSACFFEIDHDTLRSPAGCEAEVWAKTTSALKALMGAPLLVDDTPALTMQQIVARVRRAHMQAPLGLVVIDHLHIVRIPGKDPVRELGDVSRAGKALAKELRCPVVLLAQLNRPHGQGVPPKPDMRALRQSGEIEQDADWIFLLHREDYYDKNSGRRGVVDVITAKARDAEARDFVLRNRFDQMRLEDWQGEIPLRANPAVTGVQHRGLDD